MSMLQEFKDFAMKGNVLDLAVGVIMGAAFAPIVSTLVDNIVMPPIGFLMAGIDFSSLAISWSRSASRVSRSGTACSSMRIIKFLITAFAIFLLVKAMNSMKKPAPAAAPAARRRPKSTSRKFATCWPSAKPPLLRNEPRIERSGVLFQEQLPPPRTQNLAQCSWQSFTAP